MLNYWFGPSFNQLEDFVNPEKLNRYFIKDAKPSHLFKRLIDVANFQRHDLINTEQRTTIAHLICQLELDPFWIYQDPNFNLILPNLYLYRRDNALNAALNSSHEFLFLDEYRIQLLKHLISLELNLNALDEKGYTALFYLINNKRLEKNCILLLIKNMQIEYADRPIDTNGNTILHHIASLELDFNQLIKELLQLGFTLRNNHLQQMPYDVAITHKNYKFLDCLLCLKEANKISITLPTYVYTFLLPFYNDDKPSLFKIGVCLKHTTQYFPNHQSILPDFNTELIRLFLWLEYHGHLINNEQKFTMDDVFQDIFTYRNAQSLVIEYKNLDNYYSCKNLSIIKVKNELDFCQHALFDEHGLEPLKTLIEYCVRDYTANDNKASFEIAKLIVEELGIFQPKLILCFAEHVQSFDISLTYNLLANIQKHHKKEFYRAKLWQAEILLMADNGIVSQSPDNAELISNENKYLLIFKLLSKIKKNIPEINDVLEHAQKLRGKIFNLLNEESKNYDGESLEVNHINLLNYAKEAKYYREKHPEDKATIKKYYKN